MDLRTIVRVNGHQDGLGVEMWSSLLLHDKMEMELTSEELQSTLLVYGSRTKLNQLPPNTYPFDLSRVEHIESTLISSICYTILYSEYAVSTRSYYANAGLF